MNLFNMDGPVFRVLGKLADLMILNVVFLICCLPIVTIGASLTALNYVTLKMAEGKEGYIVKSFFKSFRQNFVQSTLMWLITLAAGLILCLDFYIVKGVSDVLMKTCRVALFAAAFLYLMIFTYLFAVQARFYNKIRSTFRNSLLMAIAEFPKTLIMMVLIVGAGLITFFNTQTFIYGILVWILFGFALIAYCNGHFLKTIFAKYSPQEEEEELDENELSEKIFVD